MEGMCANTLIKCPVKGWTNVCKNIAQTLENLSVYICLTWNRGGRTEAKSMSPCGPLHFFLRLEDKLATWLYTTSSNLISFFTN